MFEALKAHFTRPDKHQMTRQTTLAAPKECQWHFFTNTFNKLCFGHFGTIQQALYTSIQREPKDKHVYWFYSLLGVVLNETQIVHKHNHKYEANTPKHFVKLVFKKKKKKTFNGIDNNVSRMRLQRETAGRRWRAEGHKCCRSVPLRPLSSQQVLRFKSARPFPVVCAHYGGPDQYLQYQYHLSLVYLLMKALGSTSKQRKKEKKERILACCCVQWSSCLGGKNTPQVFCLRMWSSTY